MLPLGLAGCAKPTSLDYLGIDKVKIISLGLQESTVGADVRYYNPNKYKLTMKRAEVDVYVNDLYIGKTVLDTTVYIPKKDTFQLPVVLTIDMKKVGLGMLQTLSNDSVLVRLEGNAKVGRSGIFINYPIHYQGKQKLQF